MIIEVPNETRSDLAKKFTGIGAEIGVEKGLYSEEISRSSRMLFCVDPYQAYPGYREHVSQEKLEGFIQEAKELLKNRNCIFIRKFSHEAVEMFPDGSLDFVYIDANHNYENAKRDIALWDKKIRVGGIVAGHDYIKRKGQEHIYGVKQAVNEIADTHDIFILRGDRSPSWYYIKK